MICAPMALASLLLLADPAATAPAAVKELNLGDVAPALEIQTFLKGEPVKQLEKGKFYVVEFWATWCGPCLASIPHLTELQKKYKDVVVLGVSVDTETEEVKPFVEKQGSKMDYRVALETPGEKDGKMSESWLKASAQEGIPTAFIVNGEGRVAWIGHPGDLDEPLAAIVAGKWDLAARAEEFKKSVAKRREVWSLTQKMVVEIEARRYPAALPLIDRLRELNEENRDQLGFVKLAILSGYGDDPAAALALAKEFFKRASDEQDFEALAAVAATLVDPNARLSGTGTPKKLEGDLLQLSIDAGRQAWELSAGAELNLRLPIAQTLAKAQYAAGKKEDAARTLDAAAQVVQEAIDQARQSLGELQSLRKSLGIDGDAQGEKPAPEKPKAEKSSPAEEKPKETK